MDAWEAAFELDARWHWLRGEMEKTKRPDLVRLVEVLDGAGVPYAIIGGIALQVHQSEPRTTLDIDVAVPSRKALPRSELAAAGFVETGRFENSDNWRGPGGTPIQFTDDPALATAIGRAVSVPLAPVELRVLAVEDLLHEKLRAARDPARRRSKRIQDMADAQAILEQHPQLEDRLTPEEKALLSSLPR